MKFSGNVIKGDAYGRVLGYPTANIETEDYLSQSEQLPLGVYAGFVQVDQDDISHPAAIVISKPDGEVKLEAHILDFSRDLYGKKITFDVGAYVRPYEQYDSEKELISSISEDIIKIRLLLGLQI